MECDWKLYMPFQDSSIDTCNANFHAISIFGLIFEPTSHHVKDGSRKGKRKGPVSESLLGEEPSAPQEHFYGWKEGKNYMHLCLSHCTLFTFRLIVVNATSAYGSQLCQHSVFLFANFIIEI